MLLCRKLYIFEHIADKIFPVTTPIGHLKVEVRAITASGCMHFSEDWCELKQLL